MHEGLGCKSSLSLLSLELLMALSASRCITWPPSVLEPAAGTWRYHCRARACTAPHCAGCHLAALLPAAMYEDLKEYLNWYDTRRDIKFAKDAPIIGLVLQRSHLVTGDEGHYAGVVSELEARGAKVGLSRPLLA